MLVTRKPRRIGRPFGTKWTRQAARSTSGNNPGSNLCLGSYEQAVAWSRRAIEANRNYPVAYLHLAAALGQLGRFDEAHSAVESALALNPTFTSARGRALMTATSDNPTYLAQLAPIFDDLRKAKLPEE